MSWSDPIADMLTRIRNAQAARHETVFIPASRLKGEVARVMREAGYISAVTQGSDESRMMRVELKYKDGEPVIHGLRRDSRPGLRRYCNVNDIPRVLGGMGLTVISTSSGVMSGREARERRLGGEILCSVW